MIGHGDINDSELRSLIRNRQILLGGNARLKIYGRLHCRWGKRMKRDSRVFFKSETEAQQQNFRPCGHCMQMAYEQWKYHS